MAARNTVLSLVRSSTSALRTTSRTTARRTLSTSLLRVRASTSTTQRTPPTTPYALHRSFASAPPAPNSPSGPLAAQQISSAIEQIGDLYATARDEFEMAVEETDKETIYAAEDRAAARQALDDLLKYYNSVVVEGRDAAVAEEVKTRVGGRIRELEQAVLGLEQSVIDKGS